MIGSGEVNILEVLNEGRRLITIQIQIKFDLNVFRKARVEQTIFFKAIISF